METAQQRRGSRQKMAVLKAVSDHGDHPSADKVFLRVRRDLPGTSLSTVYRNLRILVEEGSLTAVSGPGAEVHYDHRTDTHCHARCRTCGKVFDLDFDTSCMPSRGHCSPDGFIIEGVSVSFTGICGECRGPSEKKGREE